jgi:hypothetical protein
MKKFLKTDVPLAMLYVSNQSNVAMKHPYSFTA